MGQFGPKGKRSHMDLVGEPGPCATKPSVWGGGGQGGGGGQPRASPKARPSPYIKAAPLLHFPQIHFLLHSSLLPLPCILLFRAGIRG